MVLVKLLPVDLALPGARGIFIHMNEVLHNVKGNMVIQINGVHESLLNLQWIAEDPVSHLTQMYDILPLALTIDGYHDTSGTMYDCRVIPGPKSMPHATKDHPRTALPPR